MNEELGAELKSRGALEPGASGFLGGDIWGGDIWGGDFRRCLVETGVLFFILVAFDYVVLGFGSLNQITLHPFWIPVVLVSAQFGTSGGVFAAICAIVVSRLYGVPTEAVGQDYYQHLIVQWTQPALWLSAAVVLGEMRMRHIGQSRDLFSRMRLFELQRDKMSDYCGELETQVGTLEHRIATSESACVDQLLEQLGKLSELGSQSFEKDLVSILEAIFGPVGFRLFKTGESGAALLVAHRIDDDLELDDGAMASLSLPLFHAVGKEGRLLSVLKPRDREILGSRALFGAPIVQHGTNRILGALMIEALEPEMIKPRTARLLRIVCAELGEVLIAIESGLIEKSDGCENGGSVRLGDDRFALGA